MASDSQTTFAPMKTLDAVKMSDCVYGYGRALIAGAGAVRTSDRAMEHLSELITQQPEAPLPDLASLAIRKTRDDFRQQQFECTSEEFQRFIRQEELNCELMIAHYDGALRLHTITLEMGVPDRCKRAFDAVGSGSALGHYLLSEHCLPKIPVMMGVLVAAYVVEMVKAHDLFCGGATQIGVVRMPQATLSVDHLPKGVVTQEMLKGRDYSYILSPEDTQEIVNLVRETEKEAKAERVAIMRKALEGCGSKLEGLIDAPAAGNATGMTRDYVIQELTGEPPKKGSSLLTLPERADKESP